jgi:hypothetical protein
MVPPDRAGPIRVSGLSRLGRSRARGRGEPGRLATTVVPLMHIVDVAHGERFTYRSFAKSGRTRVSCSR